MTTTTSQRWKRSEVPAEQTWDLTDLFPTTEDWEKELNSIQTDVAEVTQYKGQLGSSATALLNCLHTAERFEKRIIRVPTYASLQTNSNV